MRRRRYKIVTKTCAECGKLFNTPDAFDYQTDADLCMECKLAKIGGDFPVEALSDEHKPNDESEDRESDPESWMNRDDWEYDEHDAARWGDAD